MSKTNSLVKRIIAIVLSAMFALTSFTITGFVPTMEAQAASYNNTFATYLTDTDGIDGFTQAGSNTVKWTKAPDGSKAAYFDGTSGIYMDINTVLDQMTSDTLAFSFAAYRTCDDTSCHYFDICTLDPSTTNADAVGNRSVSMGPNYKFRTSCFSDSSWHPVSSCAHSNSTANAWDVWTITFNTKEGAVLVYKNGSQVGSTTTDSSENKGPSNGNAVNTHQLWTGESNSANYIAFGMSTLNNVFYKGYIRDFRIYKSSASTDNVNLIRENTLQAIEDSKSGKISGSISTDKYGIVKNSGNSRWSSGQFNIVNDQQDTNTDMGIIHYDLSKLKKDGYTISNVTLSAKVDSWYANSDTTGLTYFYTTSTNPNTYVSSTGKETNSSTIINTFGDGAKAHANVANIGGETSKFIRRTPSADLTISKSLDGTNTVNIDITSTIKDLVDNGATEVYFLIMQSTASGAGDAGNWSDTKVTPTSQTLSYTLNERAPIPDDPDQLIALIESKMTDLQTKFSNKSYKKLSDAYIYYVKAKAAIDAYKYSNDDIEVATQNLKTAYTNLNTAVNSLVYVWTEPNYNAQTKFESNDTSTKAFKNALSITSNDNRNFGNFDMDYFYGVIYMHDAVYVYDGSNPEMPMMALGQALTSWPSTRPTIYWYGLYPNDGSFSQNYLSFADSNWHTYNSGNRYFDSAWSGSNRISTGGGNSVYTTQSNGYMYAANKVVVNGSKFFTSNTETYKQVSFPSSWRFHHSKNGSSSNEKWTPMNNVIPVLYVINYKPVKDFVNQYAGVNLANYSQGGFKSAIDKFQDSISNISLDSITPTNISTTNEQIKKLQATLDVLNNGTTVSADSTTHYGNLRNAIVSARDITDSSIYTISSWKAFQTALTNAQNAMKYSNISGSSVSSINNAYPLNNTMLDSLVSALNDAKNHLKTTTDVVLYKNTTPLPTGFDTVSNVLVNTTFDQVVNQYKTTKGKTYITDGEAGEGSKHINLNSYQGGSTVIDDDGYIIRFDIEACDYQVTHTKLPTCTEDGIDTYTCSKCGASYTKTVAKSGHNFIDVPWVSIDDDNHSRNCKICSGSVAGGTQTASHNKQYTNNDDNHTVYCTECNYAKDEAHNYIARQDPTEPLKMIYTCICGDTYVAYGDQVVSYGYYNDSSEYVELGSFSVEGEQYSSVSELIEENLGLFNNKKVESGEDGSHIYVSSDEELIRLAYQNRIVFWTIYCQEDDYWGLIEHKDPTCTETGYDIYGCEVCGNTYTEVIEAKGHSTVIDPAIPATCTTDGKTQGSHCSVCKTVLVPQEDIPALGHAWDNGEITTQPTCTDKGIKTYHCTRDNCDATKTEDVDPLGHDYQFTQHVDPTCVAQGYDLYTCSRCPSTEKRDYEPIDPDAHNYEAKETVAPTCTEDGYTVYECSLCHATKHDDIIEKLGHNYVSTLHVNNGVYTWNNECSRCQDVESVIKTLDLTAYIANLQSAQASCEDTEAYTAESIDALDEVIQNNYIDYNAFTSETVPSIEMSDVNAMASAIDTANQLAPAGVLVLNSINVKFTYSVDGEKSSEYIIDDSFEYMSIVKMSINNDNIPDADDYAVVKWVRINSEGEETPIQTYSRDVQYIATENAEYIAYLTKINKPTPIDSYNVAMVDRLDRIREVNTVIEGLYTAKYDTVNEKFTICDKSTGETLYSYALPNYPLYYIAGFFVNDVEIGYGKSADIEINEETKIVPKYSASQQLTVYAKSGDFKVNSYDLSKSSSAMGYDIYTGGKWDTAVTFSSNTEKDWYICTDFSKALQSESNFVLAHHGKTFKFRLSNSTTVVMAKESTEKTPLIVTNYLTASGYRDNCITSASHYYLPEGCEFVEAGIIYATGNSAVTNINKITTDQIISGEKINGKFKSSVFVEDSYQYVISYHHSAVTNATKVAAKSYLIYKENGVTKAILSDVITYNI